MCSGSLLLGTAGLLAGLLATSHFAVAHRLTAFGATPARQRVVEQSKAPEPPFGTGSLPESQEVVRLAIDLGTPHGAIPSGWSAP
jgi:hypothetical protein